MDSTGVRSRIVALLVRDDDPRAEGGGESLAQRLPGGVDGAEHPGVAHLLMQALAGLYEIVAEVAFQE